VSSADGERIPRDEGGHEGKNDQDHGQGLAVAIQTNALIEEPLVRVPGGLSANRK
jgi:hypothetical protein